MKKLSPLLLNEDLRFEFSAKFKRKEQKKLREQ
jgi:hypothetical protein